MQNDTEQANIKDAVDKIVEKLENDFDIVFQSTTKLFIRQGILEGMKYATKEAYENSLKIMNKKQG